MSTDSRKLQERVLVVEDNTALAENIAELLSGEGLHVVICGGTQEIESVVVAQGFDLALVDIGLSGTESGLDLVPRLRRYSALSEIVLMTGNANLQTALQAIQSGVYAYLPKPFDPEELLALTRRALAQVALKREKLALAERLAVSEALYRGVVETVEACILGLDASGTIRFANRFASERLAPSGANLEGRSLLTLCDLRSQRALAQALRSCASGDSVRDLETRHEQPTRTVTMRWTLTPLQAEERALSEGRAAAGPTNPSKPTLLAVGLDISDRLELERNSAESQAMAVMGTLTTGLAHEIRNPLNAAKLQLELLLRRAKRAGDEQLERQLVEPAKLVRSELDRLSALLDEFLHLARPRLPVRTVCSVDALFDAVITLEQPLASSVGITFSSRIEQPGLTARFDADKLKQVMINLMCNSVDAMSGRGHGQVELVAEPLVGGGLSIAVLDDGPGLALDMHGDAAFEAFATTKPAGTGLGLSIVQKIIAQHGGTIELRDRPEGGTAARFWISA